MRALDTLFGRDVQRGIGFYGMLVVALLALNEVYKFLSFSLAATKFGPVYLGYFVAVIAGLVAYWWYADRFHASGSKFVNRVLQKNICLYGSFAIAVIALNEVHKFVSISLGAVLFGPIYWGHLVALLAGVMAYWWFSDESQV